MKRKLATIALTVTIMFTMCIGSTITSWAASNLSSVENAVRTALNSYKAEQTTSDGDLMFFVYDLLPDDMKSSEIEVYRQNFEAATAAKDGQIQFYITIDGTLVPDEDAEPFVAKIPKLAASNNQEISAELTADWRAMGQAMDKVSVSNDTTKEELLKAAKAAARNGSSAKWKEFYKVDATTDKEGAITGYLEVSLNGQSKELRQHMVIPMLGQKLPVKAISINSKEWKILRETNIERYKKGLTLLTMPAALQKACDIRAAEETYNTKTAHTRPNGTSYRTAIPSSFKYQGCGENLFKCTQDVTAEIAMNGWMNSKAHKANILRNGFHYMGVGTYQKHAVQIFAKSKNKIKSWTTSSGKKTFSTVDAMMNEYLICTDTAGVKSYVPLDTSYMKKIKGGYTIKLNSSKTIKITVKSSTTTSSGTYSDVSSADKKAVTWVTKKKIMTGINKSQFAPKVACTRGDVFIYLYRANGSPTVKIKNWFPDVKSTDPYYKAVLWAKKQDIIDYGLFYGKDVCPKGYALYYVWLSAGSPKAKKTSSFTDFNPQVFYADAVAWAEEKGIVKNSGNNRFGGDDACTRADIANYLYYAYK